MSAKTFRGGIHPEEYKELSSGKPIEVYLPKGDLVFPLSQHIGKPASPVVKKGDSVLAGQLIAAADGFISAGIVSSVSGTVKAIEPRKLGTGGKAMCIVIENDGNYTPAPGVGDLVDPTTLSNDEIIEAVKKAGIVGMGGAGFPTNVKLMPKNPDNIEYIIANGSECEPFITCDDHLMKHNARQIVEAVKLLMRLFPYAAGVIAIEENKPTAIEAMQGMCSQEKGIKVVVMQTKYPEGGERNLIGVVSGRQLRAGQLPADVGCLVCNVATLNAIYEAACQTTPLMERLFTVSGDAVANPQTFRVRIGTSCAELLEAAGGLKSGVPMKTALFGGPMMGIALSTLDTPICKNNNALTVLSEDPVETAEAQMTACIRCGRCNKVCPIGLVPQMMAVAAEHGQYETFEKKLYGMDCIQCGSCTFICPAKRPLMQLFKQARAVVLASRKK